MTDQIQRLKEENVQLRRAVMIRRVLHAICETIQIRGMHPTTPVDEVRLQMTDASARIVAPLVEAVEILEAIVWADHDLGRAYISEHITAARALLTAKWKSRNWPGPEAPY